MTPEELQALISALGNPDTAAEATVSLNEKVSAMIVEKADADAKIKDADAQIGQLRDKLLETQQATLKLAMAGSSSKPEPEEEHEETLEEFNARMAEEARKNYYF